MAYELIYTSVPRGLKPGSRGFSTVAFTEGMPANYVQTCEGISGYTHAFPPQDPNYSKNPVAFSHYRFRLGGQMFSILSRVGAYGTDYSERSNKLAHHVMASEAEHVAAGPAWAMSVPDFFLTAWKQEPHLIKTARKLRDIVVASCRAEQWQRRTGDAGWAGAIAQRFLNTPEKSVFIIFQPGYDLLPLVAEITSLLPPEKRWAFTFNTYFTALPQGTDCFLRCCLPTGEGLKMSRRSPDALILDLTSTKQPLTETGPLIEAARTGVMPAVERRSRVAYVPTPTAEEAKPDVRKPTRTKIMVSYESNVPKAPVKQKQISKSWLIPLAAVATFCILVGAAVWALPNILSKLKKARVEFAAKSEIDTSTFNTNNSLTSARTINTNSLSSLQQNITAKTNSVQLPNKADLVELPLIVKKQKHTKETPDFAEQVIPKPTIEFISASSISKSQFATNFCSEKTRCLLIKTSGDVEELAPPVKVPLKNEYSFKSKDESWTMVVRKNGLQPPEALGTNIAIARFNYDNRFILFVIFNPINLVQTSDSEYTTGHNFELYEMTHKIKNARITIAMTASVNSRTNYDAPIAFKANAIVVNFKNSETYTNFISRTPEYTKKNEIKAFIEAISSSASNVFDCMSSNPSGCDLGWKVIRDIVQTNNLHIQQGLDKDFTEIVNVKDPSKTKKDYIDSQLRQLANNYNSHIDVFLAAVRDGDAMKAANGLIAANKTLQDVRTFFNKIDKKVRPQIEVWIARSETFLQGRENKLNELRNQSRKAILAQISRDKNGNIDSACVELLSCVCFVSDTPVMRWTK